ncbi:MAG: hypothetical protein OXG62_10075 [Nitrospinae bacterium]|nr:hypothetical protein [Nitrospinota bacterium]
MRILVPTTKRKDLKGLHGWANGRECSSWRVTTGPEDWKELLADPAEHWKTGYSAKTLAYCWEDAGGCFPHEVSNVLKTVADPLLNDLTPILAVPEFKVPLPGGTTPSQNDIFVVAKSHKGQISIMVEGKVDEEFGNYTVKEWLNNASSGKQKRLKHILDNLGLDQTKPPDDVRYQLLHRAASSVIAGKYFNAVAAVMLVHSFSQTKPPKHWLDYEKFLSLFGVQASAEKTQRLSPRSSKMPLFSAWVPGNEQYLHC